ncbi:hypothetical protein AB0I66_00445 [Streptomyces sp. NPDC050439]|uniref:hypothetical protein n=1 Tax=unclassified Streptomyces TaxID=2593676 RepID=UPI00341C9767
MGFNQPRITCSSCLGKRFEAQRKEERRQRELRAHEVRDWLKDAPPYSAHLLEEEVQRYEDKHHTAARSADRRDRGDTEAPLHSLFQPWADALDTDEAVQALAPRVGDRSRHQYWYGPDLGKTIRNDTNFLYVRFADADALLPRQHAAALRLVTHSYTSLHHGHSAYTRIATGSVYQASDDVTVLLWA